MHKRLTLEDRTRIQNLLDRGLSAIQIAQKVNVCKSTVHREKRKCKGKYIAEEAHRNTYKGFHPIDYSIIGKTFGLLVVQSLESKVGVRTFWRCLCTCGNTCIMNRKMLAEYCSEARPLSCGCEPKQWKSSKSQLPYEELCHRKYLDLLKFRKINGSCWEWTGYRQHGTVPKTSFRNKAMTVRKCMYLITHIIKHEPNRVFTTCGNLLCFNPDHITLTPEEKRTYYEK